MKILYISSLSSPRLIVDLAKASQRNPGYAVQKFHRMVASGLIKNGADLKMLSAVPVVSSLSKKKCWHIKDEIVDGLHYHYIPFYNINVIRQICLFIYSFFYTIFWGYKNKRNKCIVCDVLNISICLGSVWASKIIGLSSVGIVTDMPGFMVGTSSNNNKFQFIKRLIPRVNNSYLSSFSYYVFLTEQMNEVVNSKNRPYIVMEGLVDETIQYDKNISTVKNKRRIVLYAGGLYERYGLKLLIEAIIKLDIKNVELWLYGDGPFLEQILDYTKTHDCIIYKGIRPNEEVVEAEMSATLLVNPRPTNEVFTKYSFPSKNMEYMVSGTPVLTTMLPGMPNEYYSYVYLFDKGESVIGYAEVLKKVLSLPLDELKTKGEEARRWVLANKNNVVQAERITKLLNL